MKQPCVYILARGRCGNLYTGVTSNLMARLHQHRTGITRGWAHHHATTRLVWYEPHETMEHAITREKRIKHWNRAWKLNLIERENPEWVDLAMGLGFERVAS